MKVVSLGMIIVGVIGIIAMWVLSFLFMVPICYSLSLAQRSLYFVSHVGLMGDVMAFARYYGVVWLFILFGVVFVLGLLLYVKHCIMVANHGRQPPC